MVRAMRPRSLLAPLGLLAAAALAGLLACEQRFDAHPPPLPSEGLASGSSSVDIEALLAKPASGDAGGAVVEVSHALIVTVCSSSADACPAAEADGSAGEAYRVVFGSGRGVYRSRGQAMADLYNELRNRTASGEHLVARPRASAGGGNPSSVLGASSSKKQDDDSDALASSAQRLLDMADGFGGLAIDVAHGPGAVDCVLALARAAGDGGTSQCLIRAPERPKSRGRGGIGF
jgi:hypothetical protein